MKVWRIASSHNRKYKTYYIENDNIEGKLADGVILDPGIYDNKEEAMVETARLNVKKFNSQFAKDQLKRYKESYPEFFL